MTPTILDVHGIKVAFLAYTEMTNGIPLPHPWSVNLARASLIIAGAKRARRLGAQVVIVNIHWGDEYQTASSPQRGPGITRAACCAWVVAPRRPSAVTPSCWPARPRQDSQPAAAIDLGRR